MHNTEELIHSLERNLKPVKKLWPVGLQFILWAAVSFAITYLNFLIFGIKVHMELVTDSPSAPLEVASLLALIGLSVISALILSRPDRGRLAKILPLATVGLWLAATGWAIYSGPEFAEPQILVSYLMSACFRTIIYLGIVPSLILFFLIRQGSSTKLAWASAWSGMAGAAVGYLAVRVECMSQEPFHILLSHVFPTLLFVALGIFIGKRVLHW